MVRLNPDEAYEEVIAGLCESFLTDAHMKDRAAELYRTDKGIANKFKRLLYKIKQRIAQWLKGIDLESALGKFGRQMAQKYDEILDLYVKGLDAAMNNAAYAKNAASTERMEMARYSYDDFVAKPDMNITVVDDTVTYSINAATRKSVINDAIDNAKAEGKTNGSGNAVVFVKDIDTDIIVSKRSIAHGLDRRLEFSAPVITKIGSILENSILLNELTPKQDAAIGSYVLIGYAEGKTYDYVVRFVVNKYTNEVDSVDVLYAVNTKREPAGITPGGHIAAPPTGSKISIRDLLDYVNRNYPQLLPEDVLKHYGYNARPEGDLGEDILYQQRDADYLSAVERGDMATAQRMVDEAAERTFADSRIRGEDGKLIKVYHGTDADFTVFDKSLGRPDADIQGMFFSPWDDDAGGYGQNVRAFYLNIQNPADFTTGFKAFRLHRAENNAGIKAREDLERMGYDGVNKSDEEYIAFSSEQIKSADPVTYDDSGKVIPLSERFNPEQKDIRYDSRDMGEWFDDDDAFLSEDYEIQDVFAHHYLTHSEAIGEVLKNTADIDIAPNTVKNILSRVIRVDPTASDRKYTIAS